MGDTRAPLAVTACRLCREQKVRCSHEQPTCARCSKLGLDCDYPEPPDRRLIAAQRVQSKKRPVRDSRDSLTVHQSQPKRPRSSPHALHGHPQPPPQSQAVGTQVHELTSLPQASPEALRILKDAYFTSTFNSALTFHFPTFQDDEANGSVPRHTALAMQALGANFISPLTAQGKQHYSVMRHLGDLRHVADTWALAAGKLALQEADEPTLYMVRTCQMLSLFWFSRGDSRRNTMFSGIGYKAVRAIIVESMERVKTMSSNDGFDSSPERSRAHKVECLRRLFWASWITNIINSDHYVPGSARDTLVLTLPLPISETAYRHQIEEPLTTISETFMACQSSDRPVQEPSIMAEIMKCLIIWARIRDHIDSRRHFPQKEAWHNVYSIQKDIDIWRRQLHPELKYSKRNLYHQLVVKQQPTFVMLHAIHHQCLLVLNSALVPHFSGIPMPQDIPFEAVRVSAALVLQSARALANMSAHLVALEWDPTQIAPFFGYCMYASASMQISALPRRCGTESQAWEGLTNCMKLLKLMKPYWAVLNRLWTRILPLYETQVANFRRAAATSPEHPYNAREDEDDLSLAAAEEEEFLTSPKEDNGNPQDSAEASALQYSLRTLAKDAPTSSDRSNSQMRETTCVAAEGTDQTLFPAGTGATQAVFADLAETRQGAVEQSLKSIASADPSALHVPVQIDNVVQASPYNQVGEPSLPFEPLQIAFQSSFGSLEAFDMTGLEDNNWLQLDMDSSLQARQAFNHLF